MLVALGSFVVVALLALWSLAVWALHGVAVWAVSNAGAVSGAATGAWSGALPGALVSWVPPELLQALTQLLSAAGPEVQGLLQSAPALAGGLTVASWVVWGIGSTLLLLLAAGLWWIKGLVASTPKAGTPATVGGAA